LWNSGQARFVTVARYSRLLGRIARGLGVAARTAINSTCAASLRIDSLEAAMRVRLRALLTLHLTGPFPCIEPRPPCTLVDVVAGAEPVMPPSASGSASGAWVRIHVAGKSSRVSASRRLSVQCRVLIPSTYGLPICRLRGLPRSCGTDGAKAYPAIPDPVHGLAVYAGCEHGRQSAVRAGAARFARASRRMRQRLGRPCPKWPAGHRHGDREQLALATGRGDAMVVP